MNFQHRPGGKYGSGIMMSSVEKNTDLRERQRKLRLDTIDLSKDPYFFENHLGSYECRLCLTMHDTVGSYIAHSKGSKHQINLQKRLRKQIKTEKKLIKPKLNIPKNELVRIGTPAFNVKKEIDSETGQKVLRFEVFFNEIIEKTQPEYRIVSAFEQKMEVPDNRYLYLLFAADPYETMCIKIPNLELDDGPGKMERIWNKKKSIYYLSLTYKD